MIGAGRFIWAVLAFAGVLLAYYALYFRKRQWMLDREVFERFLQGERRYKERADPGQVESYLEKFRARRRRFVRANLAVFATAGAGFFVALVYLTAN